MNPNKDYKKWVALIGIGISSMIVGVDFTIVSTVLSSIQSSLSSTVSELQWVMAGFGITFATLLTVMGRLGDILGRRLILYISMAGFLITSIGAGLSSSPIHLIVFRFLQGLFGAAIFPCGIALVSNIFSSQERGRAMGIIGGLLGIGLAAGPVLGGLIVTYLSWPWVFFINIPVIILSFLFCIPTVPESKLQGKETIDWWGMILFVFGFGILIYAITEGPNKGWTSPLIVSSFATSILLLTLFYIVEKRTKMPICPFYLFQNRGFLLGSITYIASISCCWAILFLLPLYLQNVLDYDPKYAGLLLLVMTGMTIIASPVAGYVLDKKGPMPAILMPFLAVIIGYILQLFFSVDTSVWLVVVAFIFYGWAWGCGNGIGTPLALSHLPSNENAGIVSGAAITVLNTVAVFILAIIGTIFRHFESVKVQSLMQQDGLRLTIDHADDVRALLSEPAQAQNILSNMGPNAAAKIVSIFKQGFVAGFHVSIWTLLITTLVLLVLIIKPLLKERR